MQHNYDREKPHLSQTMLTLEFQALTRLKHSSIGPDCKSFRCGCFDLTNCKNRRCPKVNHALKAIDSADVFFNCSMLVIIRFSGAALNERVENKLIIRGKYNTAGATSTIPGLWSSAADA